MSNQLNAQDRGDWLVAYRETALKYNKIEGLWGLQLYALTKMAEFAGTFNPDPDSEPLDVYPDLERMFSSGSDCDGLATFHRNAYSRLTGQSLAISTSNYCYGENYVDFYSVISRFWELLPIADAVGISVSANMLFAISSKSPPDQVANLSKDAATSGLNGSELLKTERSLLPLMRQCFNAAHAVTLKPDDPYWDELKQALNRHDFNVGRSRDETLLPVFGLGS